MSVINKMLRDLDARQTAQGKPAPPDVALPGAGLSRLNAQGAFARRGARLLAALLLLLAAGAAAWYYQQSAVSPSPTIPAAAVAPKPAAPSVVPPTPTPVALPASESLAATPAPKASVPLVNSPQPTARAASVPAVVSPLAPTQGRPSMPATPARAAANPVRVASAPVTGTQSRARAAAAGPASAAPATSGGAMATVSADALAKETLGQARNLWAQGARAGALSLLREALPAREASPAVRADLLGELARMELAEGRAAQALALLERLDGDLAQQADLWALRGNAAQRLARHPEAAESYQAALGLRPAETRWMLAAAVSLAALGQLEQAAVWAERARAAGNANPDVLGYLRQVGVPLRGGH